MNTIVFPEAVVGKESAGAYVRADEVRARITELEKQLSRYQGGVEVEAIATLSDSQTRAEVWLDELPYELVGQRVRVLVMKEVE